MTNPILCDISSAQIINDAETGLLMLRDADLQCPLFVFDQSFTHKQILVALQFANSAYQTGFVQGGLDRLETIKRLLDKG